MVMWARGNVLYNIVNDVDYTCVKCGDDKVSTKINPLNRSIIISTYI